MIRYLSGATNDRVEPPLIAADVGLMVQPATTQYLGRVDRYPTGFAADNGCFAKGASFDADRWFAWLATVPTSGCLFATAPDVVGDAVATSIRSAPWLGRIRELGLPAAYVVQNGATVDNVAWGSFDVLFVGGANECRPCGIVPPPEERATACPNCDGPLTEWKEGPEAAALVAAANAMGLWTHMGRVNTRARLRYSDAIGCDTADGTMLAFGPDKLLPRLLNWLDELRQTRLFPACV